MKTEMCPRCGEPFDPTEDTVVECPLCGIEGSTACCNMGGSNCPCNDCETAGDDDDDDEVHDE
jgi:hypothetical protein